MTKPAYLLDSNICIYVLRDAQGPSAARLGQCTPGSVVASAITLAEILRGIPGHEVDAVEPIDALFRRVGILPFDQDAARFYAAIPFGRGTFDRLLAAQALAHDLILVTNNERDFADVANLRVENWARP